MNELNVPDEDDEDDEDDVARHPRPDEWDLQRR